MPNNRTKGQGAEREVVALLNQFHFRARRGNQTSYHSTEADIECAELEMLKVRIEVKIANEFQLASPTVRKKWLEQMEKDLAKFLNPHDDNAIFDDPKEWEIVLFHRAKRQDWFVWLPRSSKFMLALDWLEEVRGKIARGQYGKN